MRGNQPDRRDAGETPLRALLRRVFALLLLLAFAQAGFAHAGHLMDEASPAHMSLANTHGEAAAPCEGAPPPPATAACAMPDGCCLCIPLAAPADAVPVGALAHEARTEPSPATSEPRPALRPPRRSANI